MPSPSVQGTRMTQQAAQATRMASHPDRSINPMRMENKRSQHRVFHSLVRFSYICRGCWDTQFWCPGVYLSQLYTFSQLPDLIDPSAPSESVDVDPSTGNYMAPSHSEVFSTLRPLPSSMQLEPLVNVHKQRKIAGVIKSLVAGQHLANKVAVEIDKKLLSKCLKLRALDHESLQRISALYSDH